MVDIYTTSFFLGTAFILLFWSIKTRNIYPGFISSFLLVIFGVLFLSTGIGFPSGDASTTSYGYSNQTINQTNYDSSYVVTGYSVFNNPVVTSKTVSTTYAYNSTRDLFTDGVGLIFILTGLVVGYLLIIELLNERKAIAKVQEMKKLEQEEEL